MAIKVPPEAPPLTSWRPWRRWRRMGKMSRGSITPRAAKPSSRQEP